MQSSSWGRLTRTGARSAAPSVAKRTYQGGELRTVGIPLRRLFVFAAASLPGEQGRVGRRTEERLGVLRKGLLQEDQGRATRGVLGWNGRAERADLHRPTKAGGGEAGKPAAATEHSRRASCSQTSRARYIGKRAREAILEIRISLLHEPTPSSMDDSNDFWFNPRTAILWIRSRVLQLTMLVQSVIAVLLGFDYIAWTEEQTGLVMALVGGVLSLAAYADQVQLRDALSMHELDKSRRGLELEAVDALGRELLDRSVRESLMWKSQTPDQPTLD